MTARGPGRRTDPVVTVAVAVLAAGGTTAEAAEAAHVSDRTVRKWLESPETRTAVATARAALLELAAGRVADVAVRAVDTLAGIMDDTTQPASVRANAAARLLERAFQLRGDDVERRLAEIERRLDGRDGRAWPHDARDDAGRYTAAAA